MTKPHNVAGIRYTDRGVYSPTANYGYGDLVSYGSGRYIYTAATPAVGVLPTTASWSSFVAPGTLAPQDWTVGASYSPGDLVVSNGSTYRVRQAVTANKSVRPEYNLVSLAVPTPASLAGTVGGTSTLVTSTDVPSGTYRRIVLTSTPNALTYPGITQAATVASGYYSQAVGQRVLLRAWVRYSVATTVQLGFGAVALTGNTVTQLANISTTASQPVAANTWTQLTGVVQIPPGVTSAASGSGVMGVYAAPNTIASGATVEGGSFEFIPLPDAVLDVDTISIPSIGAWSGETFGIFYRLAVYAPLSEAAVTSPIRVTPERLTGLQRSYTYYDPARTYQPGDLVTGADGALFEALSPVVLGEQPVRYNLCNNPRAVSGTDGWVVSQDQNGATPTLTATTDSSGTPVFRWTRTSPGGTANSTLFPMMEYRFTTDSDAVAVSFRVSTDITNSVSLTTYLTIYDQVGSSLTQNGGGGGLLAASSVLATRTFAMASSNVAVSAANGYRVLQLTLLATNPGDQLAGNVYITDVCINPISNIQPAVQATRLGTYFSGADGTQLPSSYSVAWRGAANASRSVASSNRWRLVAPAARPGRVAVPVTSLAGDVEYHYNAGERTMGGV